MRSSNTTKTAPRFQRASIEAAIVAALGGAVMIAACSAGGADPTFWEAGGNAPPNGSGGATSSTAGSNVSAIATSTTSTSGGPTTTSQATGTGAGTASSTSATGPTSTTSTTSTVASSSSTAASSSSSSTSSGAPTWTEIYDTIFGPSGTSGCSRNGSCHTNSQSQFKCGTDKTTCYDGLVSSGYVTPGAGASSSELVDPSQSCLCGTLGGNMPKGSGTACVTAAQVTTIEAWLATGAPDN